MKKGNMIEINNTSMKFNLGIEKGFSLKQGFVDFFSVNKRKLKKQQHVDNNFWALKDVSFSVKRGEVIGLIGANGAGKSTLLKIIAGVMKPTIGNVSVNGTICPMIELGAGFDMDLTARENVYLNGSVMGYNKKFINSKFNEIIDFAELWDFVDVPIKNFSSGMVARLAFSIATIVNPEILIVDEILSVGDITFQKKSLDKMMSMINGGTTVLFVSHSLDQIRQICSKIVWLEKGKIRKIGGKEVCSLFEKEMLNVVDNEKK